jgi:DNA-directed RNA polymerase subunit M/transcription elongation factor TFIIS
MAHKEPLRAGTITIIEAALTKVAHGGLAAAFHAEACDLESAIFAAAKGAVRSGPYVNAVRAVQRALPLQVGPFPGDVVALKYLRQELSAADLVATARVPPADPDPREIMRRLLIRVLMRAHSSYAEAPETALDAARAIEVSCYNAAVRASRESEDPPRRQWDSPAFVDIYGGRCGLISCLLDPESQSCREYGTGLVTRILDGSITLDELGSAPTKDLCPQATANERALLSKRAAQHIEEKESNLFRCPHCGVRRCTYTQVQRRALDEAPDYECYCLGCNRGFKGRS